MLDETSMRPFDYGVIDGRNQDDLGYVPIRGRKGQGDRGTSAGPEIKLAVGRYRHHYVCQRLGRQGDRVRVAGSAFDDRRRTIRLDDRQTSRNVVVGSPDVIESRPR